ncbi:MAG TPA: ABC transporter substrate-binding protein [Candidatus Acidoferrales bacterium]|jgi:branched-chain amino acid transport system substrate-binding protein|nr:ABC transporter substrate-binding protein [Candidatus Acidoferrales bacterium]
MNRLPNRAYRWWALLSLWVLLGPGGLNAQAPGVTDKEIAIGSCSALEGPSSFLGRETVIGAETYFQLVNEGGGINGRKLRLYSFDDSYDPAKAQACWDKLMAQKVFAMGFFVGTPTAAKYVPLADSNEIPLVGLFTGAQTLYTPLRRWVINVRASYFDETREQVDGLLNTLHYRKIGVIYPDDAFGSAVLQGVEAALKVNNSEAIATASYPRQSAQVAEAIDKVRAANPDAVVVVGPSNTVGPILKQAHGKGWKPLFLTVSFVGTDELLQDAGTDAEGMVITQVVPPYYLTDMKTVAMYRRALQKYSPNARPNFVSLEGFVDAMVLAEGLKRAGKDLTREGLIHAIEGMHDVDMGLGPELKLSYSARSHKGFDHVIPTVIRGGRAVPFTDWSVVAQK